MPSQLTRITSDRTSWAQTWRDLSTYWDLLFMLAGREVSVRYKQTVLGVLWVLLQPLTMAIIFSLVLGRMAHLPSDGIPYLVFAYSGMVLWSLFSQSVDRAAGSILADEKLVSKVYFPRWIIPLAAVLSTAVDFSVSFILLLGMLVYYHLLAGWTLLLFPIAVMSVVLTAAGGGMLLAGLNAKYRDFRYITPFLLQVGLYASPVFYSVSLAEKRLQWIFYLNPLTGALELFRFALIGTGHFNSLGCFVSAGTGLVVVVACVIAFHRIQDEMADVI